MKSGEYVTPGVMLMQQLGSGAMGSVWLAEHRALGTQVAVKLMMPEYAGDPEFVERFQAEAQAAARIRSPHVVQMLDSGVTADGAPYIVMELLEGETLGSRIRRLGPLPLRDVVRIVVQTANALGSAHRLGIVHRDIKPENLFLLEVGGEPFVKVLDFGLAKQPPGTNKVMTESGRVMGTPLYMSPEQLVSAKYVDHRTDVWALAAVAYEALTARQPFQGDTLFAQVIAVHKGGFTRPSQIRPELPEAVDTWADRALQKDPDARFGSARELADALEAAVAGELAPASRGQRAPDPAPPPTPRRVEVVSASRLPGGQAAGASLEPVVRPHPVDGTLVSGRTLEPEPELEVGDGRIKLDLGDIVRCGAEAIVNSTDSLFSGNGSLDAQIQGAAGPAVIAELCRLGGCPTGGAVVSGAGQLGPGTRFIIHAVGPIYTPEHAEACAGQLRSAYQESLRLAEEKGAREVAFPAIGAGAHQFPAPEVAAIAVGAAVDHLSKRGRSVRRVVFVLAAAGHLQAFTAALADSASIVATRPLG